MNTFTHTLLSLLFIKILLFFQFCRIGVPINPDEGRAARKKRKKAKLKQVKEGTSAIPDGWTALYDESVSGGGTPYYYNEATGETSWDRPPPVTPRLEKKKENKIIENQDKPRKLISNIYATFIRPKTIACLTMHHYDLLLGLAEQAEYEYDMFDHSQHMVFDVLMEVYRR